jgi:hypothetical protein
MDTVLLQIKNNNAYKLIENLEALNIVKVLKKVQTTKSKKVVHSKTANFRGALKLSKEKLNDFQKHGKEIRKEWPENI